VRVAVAFVALLLAGCDNLLGLTSASGDGGRRMGDGPREVDGEIDALPPVMGNLVLHVPFDTLNGSGADCTPDATGRHVVNCTETVPETITLVPGHVGSGALSLASASYLQTDSSTDFAPTSLTVSVWVDIEHATDPPAQSCVVEKPFANPAATPPDTAVSWQLCLSDTTDGYVAGNTGTPWSITFNETSLDTDWHLLAFTWDGTTVKLYFDGNLVGTHVTQIGYDVNPITIGTAFSAPGVPSDSYSAWIDDVRIYNVALDGSQIMSLSTPQ
jgi:hypothetical protein